MAGCAMDTRVFERLATLRMPLIAALNGHALGGGLELAGIADIRIAEEQIRIGLPETGLGMVPGWSGTQRLVKRFGAQPVRRMALGGEIFTAREALALGLVDQVAGTGEAVSAAREMARRIATRGPAALEIVKLMIASASGEDNGTAVEALGSILAAKTGDLKEGVSAFREKRPATVQGRMVMTVLVNPKALADQRPRDFKMLIDGRWSEGTVDPIERVAPGTASSSAGSRRERGPMPSAPSRPPARPSTQAPGRA